MADFVTITTSVLLAIALGAMLIFALARMFKMHYDRQFDTITAACFFTPIGFLLLGLLYLRFS